MNAEKLVKRMGESLIGRVVFTEEVGEYPGGLAKVVEIHPDPGAPEIVFNVQNSEWADDDGGNIIGVFADEEVELISQMKEEIPEINNE